MPSLTMQAPSLQPCILKLGLQPQQPPGPVQSHTLCSDAPSPLECVSMSLFLECSAGTCLQFSQIAERTRYLAAPSSQHNPVSNPRDTKVLTVLSLGLWLSESMPKKKKKRCLVGSALREPIGWRENGRKEIANSPINTQATLI